MDCNHIEPVPRKRNREALAIKSLPKIKKVGDRCRLEIVAFVVPVDPGLRSKSGIATIRIPRHVHENERDEQVDLIGALHRFGQVGIPRIEPKPVISRLPTIL